MQCSPRQKLQLGWAVALELQARPAAGTVMRLPFCCCECELDSGVMVVKERVAVACNYFSCAPSQSAVDVTGKAAVQKAPHVIEGSTQA
jgi:hypothetical protein